MSESENTTERKQNNACVCLAEMKLIKLHCHRCLSNLNKYILEMRLFKGAKTGHFVVAEVFALYAIDDICSQ